jgi:hypothetical protein
MIIEVGNTYRGNDGAFWTIQDGRYYDFCREFKFIGVNKDWGEGKCLRYFDKDGRTGTDLRLICKYEPTVEVPPEVWHGCVGAWNGNFTNIPTNLVWEWKVPDKIGLWICDEGDKNTTPTVEGANVYMIYSLAGRNYLQAWRCYLGPIPEVKKPLVKETMWFFQQSEGQPWSFIWMKDGYSEHTEFITKCANKHCTTTTRYV